MSNDEDGSCLPNLFDFRDADSTIADATGANRLCEYDREILLRPNTKELSVAKQCQWQPSRFQVRVCVFGRVWGRVVVGGGGGGMGGGLFVFASVFVCTRAGAAPAHSSMQKNIIITPFPL